MGTQHSTGFGYGILVSSQELRKLMTPSMKQQVEEGYVDCELAEVLGYDKVVGESGGNLSSNNSFVFFGIASTMAYEYEFSTPPTFIPSFTQDELDEFNRFLKEVKLEDKQQGWRAWSCVSD
jgi:hypothetical protein